jgi:hypothetical protein
MISVEMKKVLDAVSTVQTMLGRTAETPYGNMPIIGDLLKNGKIQQLVQLGLEGSKAEGKLSLKILPNALSLTAQELTGKIVTGTVILLNNCREKLGLVPFTPTGIDLSSQLDSLISSMQELPSASQATLANELNSLVWSELSNSLVGQLLGLRPRSSIREFPKPMIPVEVPRETVIQENYLDGFLTFK